MDIVAVITIIGFVLFVIVLLFTNQGQELKENIEYRLKKIIKKTKISKRTSKNKRPFVSGDRSKFIRDVTVSDGTEVKVNQKFTKIWEIQNVGSVVWDNRYLQREGLSEGPGRLKSKDRVRIPYTEPRQKVKIKVTFIAPSEPGSCYCKWKMVDEKGKSLLPNQKPLYISVDVVY